MYSLNQEVFLLPHSHKILLSALLGPFTDPTAFATNLYTSTSEIPTPLGLSLQKVPLSGGASTYRPLKGVPSPPLQDSYVIEKQPFQCHGRTYDLVKIRKNIDRAYNVFIAFLVPKKSSTI